MRLKIRSVAFESLIRPSKPGRPSHTYHTYHIANIRMILEVAVEDGKSGAGCYSAPRLWRLLDERKIQVLIKPILHFLPILH